MELEEYSKDAILWASQTDIINKWVRWTFRIGKDRAILFNTYGKPYVSTYNWRRLGALLIKTGQDSVK